MVQPTEPRYRDDLPHFSRFDRPLSWSVLLETQMRSVLVAVVNIGPDHAPKLPLIDRDHMVQAIPAQAAYPSFGKAVLPRGAKSRADLLQPNPIDSVLEVVNRPGFPGDSVS